MNSAAKGPDSLVKFCYKFCVKNKTDNNKERKLWQPGENKQLRNVEISERITHKHTNSLSDLLLEPVNQEVVISLRQSCDLPQQVSVDDISAGA